MVWSSNGYKYDMVNLPREDKYKVCIECYSFNQESYIRDMLDGILMQETHFPFYAIIIDDASTDGTREIIEEYCRRYPDRFSALLAYENIFGKKESYDIYRDTLFTYTKNSEYVATCEGDDYWIDKEKLRIQVEYMDNHHDCMMYLHNSHLVDCRTGEIKVANPFDCRGEKNLDMSELILIKNGHPATASRMYRQEMVYAPEYVLDCSVGDYPVMLYCAICGSVHYSDRIMCDYRFMSNGSTTEMQERSSAYFIFHRLSVAIFLLQFDVQTGYEYHECVSERLNKFVSDIINALGDDISVNYYWNKNKGNFYVNNEDVWTVFIDKYRNQLLNKEYLDEDVVDFINGYNRIIIMGTGNYADLLTNQLKYSKKKIEGYARTKVGIDETEYRNYPLWQLKKIPFDREDYILLIGIRPKPSDGIYEAIRKAGIKNYFNPYNIADLHMLTEKNCSRKGNN